MKKKKILLYGIGTYKNRGVEAIVNSTIKQIDKNKYNLSVACYDYDYNKDMYTNIVDKYINHYKETKDFTEEELQELNKLEENNATHKETELYHQKELVEEIKDSDIIISAGGDNYCYGASDWLYAIDETVYKEGKKLVFWGGSLYEKLDDNQLINNMNLFDILLLRESISYNELKKYVDEKKLILAPDPAFALEKEEVKLNKWYKNKKVIGLNLSPITIPNPEKNDQRYKSVINLINYILENTDYGISLIPHVTTEGCNDLDTLNTIYNEYLDNDRVFLEQATYNCNQIKYIISKCHMLIASRTHASIAAYSTCVPTLVIGYSVKSKGIANDIFGTPQDYVIPCDYLIDDSLINSFKWIDTNYKEIKNKLENTIPSMIEESKKLFEKVLLRLKENSKETICKKEKCIGCGLCMKNCPVNAITMEKDELGFLYPIINKDKCIDCNLCKKTCPINQKESNNQFSPICYAAKNNDSEIRKQSTSGGIFTLLAESTLKEKGAVYGAIKQENKVKHIRISNIKELEKIRGSKYSQSDLIEILELLKKDKEQNKKILFSGTPCQISAIRQLLKDYKNIIYVSVICHGVLSEKVLDKYLKEENIQSFEYRTKDNGWSRSSIKIDNTKIIPFNDSSLMSLYIQNSILRDSCYNCQFKDKNNQADIILGDYWGVGEVHKEMFDEQGVSALIINSKKGLDFINKNKILDKTTHIESNIEYIKKYNSAYTKSPIKTYRRHTIKYELENNTLKLISELDKTKYTLQTLQEKNKQNEVLQQEKIANLENELKSMKNSTRWKITDKIFNIINKILRRG